MFNLVGQRQAQSKLTLLGLQTTVQSNIPHSDAPTQEIKQVWHAKGSDLYPLTLGLNVWVMPKVDIQLIHRCSRLTKRLIETQQQQQLLLA